MLNIPILLIILFIGCGGGNNIKNENNKQPSSEKILYKDLNLSQNYIWGKTIHSFENSIEDITIDKNNNLYIVGGIQNNENIKSFILKIDSNGNKIWDKTKELNPMPTLLSAVRLDNQNNLYAIGYSQNNKENRTTDGYIIKFDENGNKVWDRKFGGAGNEYLTSIKIDDKSLYIAGSTSSYDGDITTGNNGEDDTLLIKMDINGNFLWHKTFGGTDIDGFMEIDIDINHNIICAGYTYSNDRDITETTYGSDEALIVKYTPEGNYLWHQLFGGSRSDTFYGVITDMEENIYLTGITRSKDGSFQDDNTSETHKDGLILKTDKDGNQLFNHVIRKAGTEGFVRIYKDDSEVFYAIGSTNSKKANVNYSTADAILIKFTNTGELEKQYTLRATKDIIFTAITIDQDGYIYAVGKRDIHYNNPTTAHNGIIIKISSEYFLPI